MLVAWLVGCEFVLDVSCLGASAGVSIGGADCGVVGSGVVCSKDVVGAVTVGLMIDCATGDVGFVGLLMLLMHVSVVVVHAPMIGCP